MILELPSELFQSILKYCDFCSLLALREACIPTFQYANFELSSRKSFDLTRNYVISSEYSSSKVSSSKKLLNPEKFLQFLERYLRNLEILILKNAPAHFSTSDLIQIASKAPKISHLDIRQENDRPYLDADYALSIHYFSNLKTLKMDGLPGFRISGRGCAYRVNIPHMRKLTGLIDFEFNCQHDMLCQILASMKHHNVVLPHIKRVNFSMKHSSPSFIEALIWFFTKHRTLEYFRVHNALFATLDQLSRFYGAVVTLPYLTQIVLDNCSICDRLDKLLEIRFSDELKRRGIACEGQMKSLRFDPDNNH